MQHAGEGDWVTQALLDYTARPCLGKRKEGRKLKYWFVTSIQSSNNLFMMWEYISPIFQKGLECYKIETCIDEGGDKWLIWLFRQTCVKIMITA